MRHWTFVLSAYLLSATILVGYWWRVEHRLRALEPREAHDRTP